MSVKSHKANNKMPPSTCETKGSNRAASIAGSCSEVEGISASGSIKGDPTSRKGSRKMSPTSQIEMTIACRQLFRQDILSKCDPFCLVLMKDSWQERYLEIGRTETISDSYSPEWVKKFIIDYNFETMQRIRFEIWDQNPDGKEILGYHETTLAEIVSFASRQYVRRLMGMPDKKHNSEIIIVTEELSSCKQIVQMQFAAQHLPRVFLCGLLRPDPFLVISRSNEDNTFSVVTKSEPVKSSCEPLWLPITMRVRTLCNGDYERVIKIDCFDRRFNGKHVLLGTVLTSLRQLIALDKSPAAVSIDDVNCDISEQVPLTSPSKVFPLVPPRGGAKRSRGGGPAGAGALLLKEMAVTEEISFIDYIKSGTQMHFAVAIDFTASNGPPRDPQSLHFLDTFGGKPNLYEIALRSVGEIIQQYDSAGMFPAFGFGAKVPPNGDVSHLFPLNGNSSHPYCSSVSEIITHYRNCLATVTLYGPTNFSLAIQNTAQIAGKFQDGKHYFILLIITDGILSDMQSTKRAIINASNLPISIIIVGVGAANFDAMDELDSDDIRLSVDRQYAERDIVQFVPLSKFLSKSGPYVRSQADLAREVLAEIPDQMTGYMKAKGFMPDKSLSKNS